MGLIDDDQEIITDQEGLYNSTAVTMLKSRHSTVQSLVSTRPYDIATPASTYAHVTDRKLFDSISLQMAQCPFEVMIGGDKNHFLPENRKDGTAPLDSLVARGYDMVYSVMDMSQSRSRKICSLLTPDNPDKAMTRGRMLTLGALKAIETLNGYDNGFVLMIEGSQIDWACHDNETVSTSPPRCPTSKTCFMPSSTLPNAMDKPLWW